MEPKIIQEIKRDPYRYLLFRYRIPETSWPHYLYRDLVVVDLEYMVAMRFDETSSGCVRLLYWSGGSSIEEFAKAAAEEITAAYCFQLTTHCEVMIHGVDHVYVYLPGEAAAKFVGSLHYAEDVAKTAETLSQLSHPAAKMISQYLLEWLRKAKEHEARHKHC